MVKLSIIVPTFNSAHRIGHLIAAVSRSISSSYELIIVDDYSTDGTRDEVIRLASLDQRIKTIFLTENEGAGPARNAGFEIARGEYILFCDDDDELIPSAVDKIITQLDLHQLDVAITSYALSRGSFTKNSGPMLDNDEYRFSNILAGKQNKIIRPDFYPIIFSVNNFPWNKVCKSTYLRNIGLKFPSVRLHEDILPHWNILLNTEHVLISNEKICNYRLPIVGKNASHQKDSMRLQVFDALIETNKIVLTHDRSTTSKAEYLEFCLDVLSWARSMISIEYREIFDKKLRDFWSIIGLIEINGLMYTKHHTAKRIFEIIAKGTI